MREVEIATRHKRYHPKKVLPQRYIYTIYIVIIGLFIITITTKIKIFLFLFVTLLSGIINYQTNLPTIRFNPDPEVFFSLLLTRICGFQYAIFMIFVPTLLVDLYTARLDKDTFVAYFLTLFINYLLFLFPASPFVLMGLILVSLRFVLGLIINILLGISPQEIVFEHLLGFFSNIVIFLTLGSLFLQILA